MNTFNTITLLIFSARQHIAYMLSALYRLSVRLSVCQTGGSYNPVEARIMQFSPYGSTIPPVFVG